MPVAWLNEKHPPYYNVTAGEMSWKTYSLIKNTLRTATPVNKYYVCRSRRIPRYVAEKHYQYSLVSQNLNKRGR